LPCESHICALVNVQGVHRATLASLLRRYVGLTVIPGILRGATVDNLDNDTLSYSTDAASVKSALVRDPVASAAIAGWTRRCDVSGYGDLAVAVGRSDILLAQAAGDLR